MVVELALFFYIPYQLLYSTAYAQIGLESSPSMTPQTETVTSYYDALLKVPLIVSQAAIVGIVLNHIILRRVILNKIVSKSGKIGSTAPSKNTRFPYPLKRFFLILLACGIAMIVSATSLFLLQAFSLSSELGIDVVTTFNIISSTPIGPVWNVRVITSLVIIVSSCLYYILERKCLMKNDVNIVNDNNSVPLRETRGISVLRIVLLCIVIISGAISIFSNSIVSHNTALTFFPSLAISVDWLHFMAVSIWLGGLFYISTLLLTTIRLIVSKNRNIGGSVNESLKANTSSILALLLPYFSLIATLSLGIIGITGLYMAWIHLHAAEAIFTSLYGNILAIKLLLALPMIILGAYHQIKLHSSLMNVASLNKGGHERHDDKIDDPSMKFSKTIKIESLFGIAVLFAASFLTITSPPSISMQGSLSTKSSLGLGEEGLQDYTPSFDLFTILAIILAAAVLSGSIVYFKKSKHIIAFISKQM